MSEFVHTHSAGYYYICVYILADICVLIFCYICVLTLGARVRAHMSEFVHILYALTRAAHILDKH